MTMAIPLSFSSLSLHLSSKTKFSLFPQRPPSIFGTFPLYLQLHNLFWFLPIAYVPESHPFSKAFTSIPSSSQASAFSLSSSHNQTSMSTGYTSFFHILPLQSHLKVCKVWPLPPLRKHSLPGSQGLLVTKSIGYLSALRLLNHAASLKNLSLLAMTFFSEKFVFLYFGAHFPSVL